MDDRLHAGLGEKGRLDELTPPPPLSLSLFPPDFNTALQLEQYYTRSTDNELRPELGRLFLLGSKSRGARMHLPCRGMIATGQAHHSG
jgi:hypothetical protein